MCRYQPAAFPLAGGLVASCAPLPTSGSPLAGTSSATGGGHAAAVSSPPAPSVSVELRDRALKRSANLSWPFAKRTVDPAERAKAVLIYRRLFTQPRRLATLRAEFDAAVHEGSANGTDPELLDLLQGHAAKITGLMTAHWETVVKRTEPWPRFRTRRGEELADELRELFIEYVEKTLRWLDYFVLDPRWLNLTAVNYAANAARETAGEVREARSRFEEEYELYRDDLSARQPAAGRTLHRAPMSTGPDSQDNADQAMD